MDPVLPSFCLTELWVSLKSMIFDILGFSMEAMGTHGDSWGPMGTHGNPWGPMETHGNPWEPMGTHDSSWVPMGPHGFSMNYRGGRRPTKNVGGCGGGAGAPPTNMFGFKSPSGDLKPNRNTNKPVL